eukprot:7429276-Alexandrium_andersonii.AAC.1
MGVSSKESRTASAAGAVTSKWRVGHSTYHWLGAPWTQECCGQRRSTVMDSSSCMNRAKMQ